MPSLAEQIAAQKTQMRKAPGLEAPDRDKPPTSYQSELQAVMARMRRVSRHQQDKTYDDELGDVIVLGISHLKKVTKRRDSMGIHKSELVPKIKAEQAFARMAKRWKPPVKQDVVIDPSLPVCAICGYNLKEDEDMVETPEGEFHPGCFSCTACKSPVQGDYLTVGQTFYHPLCLRCTKCGCSLGAAPLAVGPNGKVYCADHSDRPICNGCDKRITDDQILEQLGAKWHLACFRCEGECNQSLSGRPFVTGKDGRPYCPDDYAIAFADRCSGCNQPATGQVYKLAAGANTLFFHAPCYRCMSTGCGRTLAGKPSFVVGDQVRCQDCKVGNPT